jgi:tetratricopeptide (TPR) repeat protein
MTPSHVLRIAGAIPLAILVSVSAMAQAPAPATNLTDGPSRTWKRLETTSHIVVGDADERYLRDALGDLESVQVMVRRWMPHATQQGAKTTAVVLRDASDKTLFYRMDGEGKPLTWTLAYYQAGSEGNHIVFAVDPIERRERLSGPFNVYGRTFVYGNASPTLPAWVWQGLSHMASSLPIDHLNRDRVVGRPLPSLVKHLQGATLWPLADLIDFNRSMPLMQKNPPLFWAQSWALMHYLLLGREGRTPGQLMAYIDATRQGRPSSDAFAAAFGANVADLQSELERYIAAGKYPVEPLDVSAVTTAPVSPMLESEVEALHGELFVYMNNYAQAEAPLLRALARNPKSRRARLALAQHRIAHARFQDAATLLAPVVAETPDNPTVTLILADAYRRARQYDQAYATATRAVKLAPANPAAWLTLSSAALAVNRDDEANAAMDTVQTLRPGGVGFYFTRAREAWAIGRFAVVVRDAEACVRAPNCGPDSTSYASFIGALAARHLGQSAVADALLAASAKAAATDYWRSEVHTYLTGKSTAAEFLNKGRHNGEHTEAHAYIGVMANIAGRRDEALEHLRWVRDRGAKHYTEYPMAVSELERIEGKVAASR